MYSKIASIYNIFLWQEFSQDLFKGLEIFLYEWKINTHLDIACGTGDFVYLMKKAGVNSSGSDISREMIIEAKKNYPGLGFSVSDMRNFLIKERVDLITCNFDSINHLLKFREWENSFLSVYNSLNDDGKFLFDINTLELINNHREKSKVKIKGTKMDIDIYPVKNNILIFDIVSSRLKCSQKTIIREKVRETSFKYSIIKKSLLNIGFKKVVIFNKSLGFSGSKKRKYILAIK